MEKQSTEKLSDKAFSRMILTSVLSIVLCLVALCSMTWAWFSDDVAFDGNEIQTADTCSLTVTVVKDEDEESSPLVLNGSGTSKSVDLLEGVTYTVTLSLPKGSASGYCLITVDDVDDTKYYTDYIERHDEELKTVTFKLTVAETKKVTFKVCWGIYSGTSDVEDGKLEIR